MIVDAHLVQVWVRFQVLQLLEQPLGRLYGIPHELAIAAHGDTCARH